MVLSCRNRVAQRLDDEPGDAEIPSGRDPNIAGRTNDNARPAATIGQSRLLRRSHSSASQAPANHPPSAGVNPDASLSCRAPGSDAPAQHGRAVPAGCIDSAGRPHAARGAGHDQRNRRRNRSDRDRSSCRSAPGCDIPCKQTAGPARHHHGRIDKHPVDERHVGRDTRLACVPGTMCGTASSLTAKFNIGAVPAFRLKQAFTRCPTNRQPVAHRNGIIQQRTTIVRQSLPVAPRITCRQIWACLGSHRHEDPHRLDSDNGYENGPPLETAQGWAIPPPPPVGTVGGLCSA
jgi:hypothetical protein